MVFSSVVFLFYFAPIFFICYFLSGARNAAIIVGSLVFYSWGEARWLPILLTSVALNYWIGKKIDTSEGRNARLFLILGVSSNLLIIGIFKYLDFFLDNMSSILGTELGRANLGLPLGISFYTFQAISYLIDIYRKEISAESRFGCFATYIIMFPQIIAGPIVRLSEISSEIGTRKPNSGLISGGLQYFIIGLSQKVIIANTVAVAADYTYGLPLNEITMVEAWVGSISYMIQIYFDFCGYSNMAIGLAMIMGFHFPKNFNHPYISRSIGEFWRRWHITLSFWFRDYVYIPLGGSRNGILKTIRNIMIVFALTGLWHGASWTFVIWGLYHGFFLTLERLGLRRMLEKLPSLFSRFYALLVILVGWIIFRAEGMEQVSAMLSAMVGYGADSKTLFQSWFTPEIALGIALGVIFSTPIAGWVLEALGTPKMHGERVTSESAHPITRVQTVPTTLLIILFTLSTALLVANSLNPFLYFRF